jgi:hypothetical protein
MANVTKETNVGLPVALALIAGILMVIGGIVFLSMTWYHSTFIGYPMMGMMGGMWSNFMQGFTPWLLGISISSIICGGIVLFSGTMMSKDPGNARFWGILILIMSSLGIISGMGFLIGPILGIIAGVVALSIKNSSIAHPS